MKATRQCLIPVVLFVVLFKALLMFESVHEILNCDHSIESVDEHIFAVALKFAGVLGKGWQRTRTFVILFILPADLSKHFYFNF